MPIIIFFFPLECQRRIIQLVAKMFNIFLTRKKTLSCTTHIKTKRLQKHTSHDTLSIKTKS